MSDNTKNLGEWLEPLMPEEVDSARQVILTAARVKVMLDTNRQSEKYHRILSTIPLGEARYSVAASLTVIAHMPTMIWRAIYGTVRGIAKELFAFGYTLLSMLAMTLYCIACICQVPVPVLRWFTICFSGFKNVKDAVEDCVISDMSEGIYRKALYRRAKDALRVQQGLDGSVQTLIRRNLPEHILDPMNELSSSATDEFNKFMAGILDIVNQESGDGIAVEMRSSSHDVDGVKRRYKHGKKEAEKAKKFEQTEEAPSPSKLRLTKDPE